MDPKNEAQTTSGEPDSNRTMEAFSRSEIIRALKGHPSVVQDLCAQVSEERSLILRKNDLLTKTIPEVRAPSVAGVSDPGELASGVVVVASTTSCCYHVINVWRPKKQCCGCAPQETRVTSYSSDSVEE